MIAARDVYTVYRKELRETLRDRRTLAIMILLPLLLYPLMTVVVSEWVISHELERRRTASRIQVVGAVDEAEDLVRALRTPAEGTGPRAVEVRPGPYAAPPAGAGKQALAPYHAVVEVPPGWRAALEAGRAGAVRVYYDGADDDSAQAHERVEEAIEALGQAEKARRLGAHGLDPRFADPVAVEARNLASRAKLGRKEISKTLPFILILMTLLGSFYPAIDLTAGEKERGTLEPLLATPMSRQAIVGGKYLCVATVSALTAFLNLLCMALAALWIVRSAASAAGKGGLALGALAGAFPWSAAGLALIGLAGATLLFSGVMMAIASLARNFKEAQNYLTPVHMVMSIPAMVAFLPGTSLDYGTAFIPVANVTLLLKDATAGTLAFGPAACALLAIGIYAGLAMALAARIYDSERLLFAPEASGPRRSLRERLGELFTPGRGGKAGGGGGGGGGGATSDLGPANALALFAVVAVLLVYLGPDLQRRGPLGLAASQWLLIGLPTLFVASRRPRGLVDGLALTLPSPRHALGAALVGLSAWGVLAYAVLPIQERLFPAPRALAEELERMLAPEGTSALEMLFAAALTPAICEELLCRGALARSLRGPLGDWGAILVSALLFAILHLSPYRLLPTFALGILLAVVAFSARSTVASMIVHLLNNATIALLQLHPFGEVNKWLEGLGPVASLGFVIVLSSGLYLVVGAKRLDK